MNYTNTNICEYCQVSDQPLKFCSGCNAIYYCSRQCQLSDWKVHKEECTEMMFAKLFETLEFEPFETCQKNKKGELEDDILQKGYNLISFLKTFYIEQYNPYLNRLSPFLLPADDKIISCSVRPNDFFGLIIYNKKEPWQSQERLRDTVLSSSLLLRKAKDSNKEGVSREALDAVSLASPRAREGNYVPFVGRRCNIDLTKEDSKICIVDYEAISSFVQYFVYQQQDLRKLLKNRIKEPWQTKSVNEDKILLIEKIVKQSISFVMKCLINDLQDVHCYKVNKTDKWNLQDPTLNEEHQATFRIYLERTTEDMLRKINLDPSIPHHHFLFRSINKTILIEKTKTFNNDFLSYLQYQFKKLESY